MVLSVPLNPNVKKYRAGIFTPTALMAGFLFSYFHCCGFVRHIVATLKTVPLPEPMVSACNLEEKDKKDIQIFQSVPVYRPIPCPISEK
jgi:hypothetical protein